MNNRFVVSFGNVVRGGGKIFILLKTRGCHHLVASSTDSEANELPASLVRISENRWVALVAVFSRTQVLTVCAKDDEGHVLGIRKKTITPLAARASSVANTLCRNAAAEEIRNIDRRLAPNGMRLTLDELMQDTSDELLRGRIEFETPDSELAHRGIKVDVLSGDGEVISTATALVDDVLRVDANSMGDMVRSLRFSCRIAGHPDSLIAWARLEGAHDWDAFATIEPFEAAGLREQTTSRYLAADETYEYMRRVSREAEELPDRLEQMRAAIPEMPWKPTFSLVVPVFNTPLDFLYEMVESVLGQVYPRYELLLLNASPENDELSRKLKEFAAHDERIVCHDLGANLGITENTNVGIRLASGDFVCFLDHDDTIEPDALWWYARAACEHPEVDLMYCDEDHLQEGQRVSPFFKPDWDPDRMCTENYVCEFDGSQDHNMTFLVGERARYVHHEPRILYHWRMHAGSTAGSEGVAQKSYALDAERRAIQAHVDRVGILADVVKGRWNDTRCDLSYRLDNHLRISVLIAHDPRNQNLVACITELVKSTDWRNLEIVVAGSLGDGDIKKLLDVCNPLQIPVRLADADADSSECDWTYPNRVAALNRAIACATGEYVLLLSEDACAFEDRDWLEELVGPVACGDSSCVGAKIERLDGSIQCVGYLVGDNRPPTRVYEGYPASADGYYEYNVLKHRVSAVSADCLMTRRSILADGLDADFPTTFDVAFCLRLARSGGTSLQQNNARVTLANAPLRYGSVAKDERDAQELSRLRSCFPEAFARRDPYYTPNVGEGNLYFGYAEDDS